MRNIIISPVVQNKVTNVVKSVSVDAGFRYADIENRTYTEIAKTLEAVDSVILKRPAAAMYVHTAKWNVDLKKIDVEFLKRISNEYPDVDPLIHHFHEIAFAKIDLPRLKYTISDTIENILTKLEINADKLMITKKQLMLLKSIYMISISDKTAVVRDVIYGIRKQLGAVQYLIDICIQNNIKAGVLDGDGVIQIESYEELETCASTFVANDAVDIHPSNRIIGNGYIITVADTKDIHKHITKLLRSGCHDATKFVFMKTRFAFEGVNSSKRNKHPLNPYNTTYYGSSDDARHHDTVVLLGVPRLNPRMAFLTDPDPVMSAKRYHRFHLLHAIGRARVVYCVGISTQYLEDVLSGIPGIRYYDEHHNDPSKR